MFRSSKQKFNVNSNLSDFWVFLLYALFNFFFNLILFSSSLCVFFISCTMLLFEANQLVVHLYSSNFMIAVTQRNSTLCLEQLHIYSSHTIIYYIQYEWGCGWISVFFSNSILISFDWFLSKTFYAFQSNGIFLNDIAYLLNSPRQHKVKIKNTHKKREQKRVKSFVYVSRVKRKCSVSINNNIELWKAVTFFYSDETQPTITIDFILLHWYNTYSRHVNRI